MSKGTEELVSNFNKSDVLEYLTNLDFTLSGYTDVGDIDYASVYGELISLVQVFCDPKLASEDGKVDSKGLSAASILLLPKKSHTLFALLSRNLINVLAKLPNKVYDTANNLLPFLVVDENGCLYVSGQLASVLLIDVLEHYPSQLPALINFAATSLYKILKKSPLVDGNIAYLLSRILAVAQKSDIDEKFQAKWIKLLLKAILSYPILNGGSEDQTATETSTVELTKYYIQAMKNLLVLLVSSNYQQLLEISTSSTSGSKLKPEALMTQQGLFQTTLLTTHDKLFHLCLLSQFREIRSSMVDLISTLLLNFVDTGKFNAYEYLLDLYTMPNLNYWDESLQISLAEVETALETRKDTNLVTTHDSDSIILANSNILLTQIGVVETFIMFTQLQLFQNWEFYPTHICSILDSILLRFGALNNPAHVQNQQWVRTLSQWRSVVEFLLRESGSATHEILATYVAQKFSSSRDSESLTRDNSPVPGQLTKEKRRESGLFSFKSSKKSRSKGPVKEIHPYSNGYQLNLLCCIIECLLPYGVDFAFSGKAEGIFSEDENQDNDQSMAEEEDKLTSKKSSYVSALLLILLANDSTYVRNYALTTLIKYVQINKVESNQLILNVFQLVNNEYEAFNSALTESPVNSRDRNISASVTVRLFSYSLALASLIKQADATVLQNSTIAKILSFCTQNLKQYSNLNKKYLKSAACWVILSALVKFYSDSEFVKLNSSQFLVFWKNLLTSQFISSDLNASSEQGQLVEIVNNLKLRSLSLICLINYICSIPLTPDLSKQLQFLLVKSHKYIIYLESNLEAIGSITGFHPQAFNESDYNPNLVNNLLFSNFNDSKALSIDKQLISLILYNKKIVLNGFIKLSSSLKSDVNSSLVVFLMKVFADSRAFSRLTGAEIKEKSKSSKSKTTSLAAHEETNLIILDEEYNYNFGVTSKFTSLSNNIDELNKSDDPPHQPDHFLHYKDPFGYRKPGYSKLSIESSLEDPAHTWLDYFESMIGLPSSHSVNYDPCIFILQEYSFRHQFSTNLITSLIDLSIELFQLVFPSLSFKIQFSLLEQLRSSLSAKNLDPLRKRALAVNVSVALHGLLNNLAKRSRFLSEELVALILEIVGLIEVRNVALVTICADSNGLATSLLPKQKVEETIAKFINDIVSNTNPHTRGKLLLSLSKINQYCHVGFSEIVDVVFQLLADPHPVVSYYSITAAGSIAENALGNQALMQKLIDVVHIKLLNDDFSLALSNKSSINMRSTFNSMAALSRLLKVVVTSLGPSLRDLDDAFKSKIVQLLLTMSYGIGSSNLTEYNAVLISLMTSFQELLIFDSSFVSSIWFSRMCKFLVTTNLKTGLAIISPTSVNSEAIFPVTTSYELYELAYSGLVEMTKIGLPTLNKDTLSLAWVSMELRPCHSLNELISFWIESNIEALWFSQLTALFKISVRRLIGPFIETHFQQKLLPLLQRHKKKINNTIDFQDEEVQNIVKDDESSQDKNEPISWEFKLFVYDLIIKLLEMAEKRPLLVESLTPKIQEIVRMSFLGTAAPISAIKLRGVDLLDKALSIFGHLEDPLYPGVSILEQQQAQIISALIPCFGSDSGPYVIVKAINVSSKFINLPRIKFYSKQRILKTLIYLLEEISSNKFLKFVFLESMAEYGRKAIQLSILNCWANLKINLEEQEENEPEFEEILNKYADLLTSLWILLLKDFSTTKYNQPDSKELQLYSTYWLNFVGVLSLELEKDHSLINKFLEEEESSFFFVMFCQCAEALIKNQNVSQVLYSVNRLVQIPELVRTLFSDELFGEVIDLVDRLVLMEDDTEIKCEVIDTVSTMFRSYSTSVQDFRFEKKLFELLRVTLLPLFDIFPFLRLDYSPDNAGHKLLLKHCNSATNLLVLKKLLSAVVNMIQQFDDEARYDLSSCILYIFAKIYEYDDDILISLVLPFLKSVVSEASSKLATPFLDILRQTDTFSAASHKINYILTMTVLVTGGGVQLNSEEVDRLASVLVECLDDRESASTAVHAIKSLIKHSSSPSSGHIMRKVLKLLLVALALDHTGVDAKIAFEIIILFTQSSALDNESKVTAMYAIVVPLLVEFEQRDILPLEYLNAKILALVNYNPNAFKLVVNEHLDADQKSAAERLVKLNQKDLTTFEGSDSEIELKNFAI
ncbi:CIC11C00000005334 [Sungouiella intermedia]|uniref:CIC11C00000005334 n=1 Tax=Sungouiella intermedia TaxID=45354 RepID=A0A1L0DF64_9ASCO|nr:CIC11C00000005334 [[Candida] intermedia]